jgi:hypothetical protein
MPNTAIATVETVPHGLRNNKKDLKDNTAIATVETVPPLLMPIEEARQSLGGLSRQSVYNLINAGKIDTARIGGRRFVVVASLRALVAASTEAA